MSHSKEFRLLSVRTGSRGSNDLRIGKKIKRFQLFSRSRERVVVRQSQIRRIGWVIKTLQVQVGRFLVGGMCAVRRDIVVLKEDSAGDLPLAFFLSNVLQLHSRDG